MKLGLILLTKYHAPPSTTTKCSPLRDKDPKAQATAQSKYLCLVHTCEFQSVASRLMLTSCCLNGLWRHRRRRVFAYTVSTTFHVSSQISFSFHYRLQSDSARTSSGVMFTITRIREGLGWPI